MKRMCKRLLAAVLCLLLAASAMAEGMLTATPAPELTPMPLQATPVPPTLADVGVLSVLPETFSQDMYRMLRTVVPVGDALYIMTYTGQEALLWRWTEDMPSAQRVGDPMLYAHHHVSMEEARQNALELTGNADDAAFAVSTIFSDGQTLYGYNGLTHAVFTIRDTGAGLEFQPGVKLAKISDESLLMPSAAFIAGEWLLWQDYDYRSGQRAERLLAFNLHTGGVKQAVLPETIKAIAPWKNGQALVMCRDSQDVARSTIYTYDPARDAAEKVGALPKEVNARRIAYNADLGVMVYQDKTRLMGWTPEGTSQVGYIPARNDYAQVYSAGRVALYSTDDENLQAVQIRQGYATDRSITMLGGTMYTVLSQFYNRYQDIPVYYTSQKGDENWREVLARKTDMPDLILWNGPTQFQAAVDEGQLMDLSGYEAIREYIDALYPAFRDVAMQDGKIWGVPIYADSYGGWYINKKVMNDMGLTPADIPTTFEGMIAFAKKWNDEWAEKYPHFTLLNETTNYRERLYYAIENEWRQLCEKDGKPVNYDDPTYMALLEKLDAADFTKLDAALKQTDPEVSEYKQALIWTGVKDVGNFDTYMEEYSDRIFLPMTLTADTPYVVPVLNLRMWVVNGRSENGEYVAELLAESVAKLEGKTAYTLRADMTEPVENEAYAEQLAYQLEYLASLEASVEKSVNKDAALRRVEEQKAYIDNGMNGRRYLINPSAIENYRSVIMPAAYVPVHLPYEADDDYALSAEELQRRYLRREITAAELVKALDALVK